MAGRAIPLGVSYVLLVAAGLLAELASLVLVGGWLGWLTTFGLLVLALALGVAVLSGRALATAREVLTALTRGESPAPALVDGVLLAFAGLLLVTPGFASDVVGLALLVPPVRSASRTRLVAWVHRRFGAGHGHGDVGYRGPADGGIEVIDVSGTEVPDRPPPSRRGPGLPS